jgi:hypothetical protein
MLRNQPWPRCKRWIVRVLWVPPPLLQVRSWLVAGGSPLFTMHSP